MELDEYQVRAGDSDNCSHIGLPYYVSGLAGEAGEIAEKIKKHYRDDAGTSDFSSITHDRRELLLKELGDVLWYVARFANHLGYSLEEVGSANIEKLASRMDRGKLGGDGDER